MFLPPEILYEIYLLCDLRTKHNCYLAFGHLLTKSDIRLHKMITYNDLICEKNAQFWQVFKELIKQHRDCKMIYMSEMYENIKIEYASKYFGSIHCFCGVDYKPSKHLDSYNHSGHIKSEKHQKCLTYFFTEYEKSHSWTEFQELLDELTKGFAIKLVRRCYWELNMCTNNIDDIYQSLPYFDEDRKHLFLLPNGTLFWEDNLW